MHRDYLAAVRKNSKQITWKQTKLGELKHMMQKFHLLHKIKVPFKIIQRKSFPVGSSGVVIWNEMTCFLLAEICNVQKI